MKEKLGWKKVILEALMIVLSVLLALFINEWKRNSNERQNTDIMLQNINVELSNNKKFLEQLLPYHGSVLEKMQVAALKDSLIPSFLSNGYFDISNLAPKGIKQGEFQNIAWSIAKEERISNRISFDDSELLFAAYEQQARVLKTMDRIINILGSREIHRKELIEESVIILALEWNEMIAQEQELLNRYNQAIAQLNTIN